MSVGKRILRFLFKDEERTKIVLVNLVLLFLLVFFKDFLIILAMIILSALSMLHQRVTRSYIGFELVTLATIFSSMFYGAKAGMIVGVVGITSGLMLNGNFDHGIIVSVMGMFLIGLVASFFPLSSIFMVGLVATVVYDVVLLTFYFFTGANPVSCVSYFITHVYINYILFKLVSSLIGLV